MMEGIFSEQLLLEKSLDDTEINRVLQYALLGVEDLENRYTDQEIHTKFIQPYLSKHCR